MINQLNYPRTLQSPKNSFFLLGPRGTGKSTWLRQHFSKALVIDLLNERLFQELLADPSLFYEQALAVPNGGWIVVDEIQRLPALLNDIHRLIEDKRLKFALTGSSARKLRKAGVNLLGGRASMRTFYPLTAKEMGPDFDLTQALQFGTLPLVLQAEDQKDRLQSYVQLYLKEEIQAEALVKNLAGFSRFLPISALLHGQTLNISNIARDAGITRATASGFFSILEDTLLGRKLEAFESKIRVREKKHPKFYWVDAGIARAARKQIGAVSEEERGALLEGLVYMLLCAKKDYIGEIDDIHFWSPAEAANTEVDFLVTQGNQHLAIEVKATKRLRPDHFRGLKAIEELKQVKKRILIYLGTERRIHEGIEILPFKDALHLFE